MPSRVEWVEGERPIRRVASKEIQGQFEWTHGHLLLSFFGLVYSISFTFWITNGIIDFATGLLLGNLSVGPDLLHHLFAYILLIPAFMAAIFGYHLVFNFEALMAGKVPRDKAPLSLDWFAVSILSVTFPHSLKFFGPWTVMIFLIILSVFVVPIFANHRLTKDIIRMGGIFLALGAYTYLVHGAKITPVTPDNVLPNFFTYTLKPEFIHTLTTVTHGIISGPIVIGTFAVFMNVFLTRRSMMEVPVVRLTVPTRVPNYIVFISAYLGTTYYLLFIAVLGESLTTVII